MAFSRGPQEGVPVLPGPAGGAPTPDCMEPSTMTDGLGVVSRASVPLPPQSSLCQKLQADGLVWVKQTAPLSSPLLLPPQTVNLQELRFSSTGALHLCTDLIISLGDYGSFTRAKLNSAALPTVRILRWRL
ncbi:hypothetical protein HJG60_007797 [Phyllostomus discolor]|uniref:Uncharacterized protein n=1 Tax=Phyllostomus discolor TaxID=89673 RepID=A0A834EVK5_9CHIR|nr:hypothetical protein HJG60_007797 [Phyllostomus discolor]